MAKFLLEREADVNARTNSGKGGPRLHLVNYEGYLSP
jgi:hypothetical protein